VISAIYRNKKRSTAAEEQDFKEIKRTKRSRLMLSRPWGSSLILIYEKISFASLAIEKQKGLAAEFGVNI